MSVGRFRDQVNITSEAPGRQVGPEEPVRLTKLAQSLHELRAAFPAELKGRRNGRAALPAVRFRGRGITRQLLSFQNIAHKKTRIRYSTDEQEQRNNVDSRQIGIVHVAKGPPDQGNSEAKASVSQIPHTVGVSVPPVFIQSN
jgi:hypothetical protein